MAATYDTDVETTGTAVTSLTVSITVANNSNRVMVVGVAAWDATAGDSVVSGVTFNAVGTGWAQHAMELGPGANLNRVSLWRKVAPDVATANVVVTFTGTVSEAGINALSAFDVDQATPLGTATTAEGTDAAPSIVVSGATGDLVYDTVYANRTTAFTPVVGGGQTSRANNIIFTDSKILASTELGAASVTMSWSWSASGTEEWVSVGAAMKAVAAGTTMTPGQGPVVLTGPVLRMGFAINMPDQL